MTVRNAVPVRRPTEWTPLGYGALSLPVQYGVCLPIYDLVLDLHEPLKVLKLRRTGFEPLSNALVVSKSRVDLPLKRSIAWDDCQKAQRLAATRL